MRTAPPTQTERSSTCEGVHIVERTDVLGNGVMDQLVADLRSGRERMCDGPMNTDGMRRKIVGRVVGVVAARDRYLP